MKKMCCFLLIICVCVMCSSFGTIAFAEESSELIVSEESKSGINIIKVLNIQDYAQKSKKKKRNSISVAKDIYSELQYTADEIEDLNVNELLYILQVESVEVHRYIIEVDAVSGEQQLRASVPSDLLHESEPILEPKSASNAIVVPIGGSVTDVKSNDWMKITSIFYQDSQYNKTYEQEVELIDKNGNPYTVIVNAVERYGYKCDFTFTWLSNPLWRSVEELGIAWSTGNGIYISGQDASVYQNKGSVTYNYSYGAAGQVYHGSELEELDFEINGICGRSLAWNLPSNISGVSFGSFEYKLGVILETAVDLNMIASYAHRTFGAGGLGISIGPVSISFSASNKSVFTTGAYLIDVPAI